jgi:hypothetical protein
MAANCPLRRPICCNFSATLAERASWISWPYAIALQIYLQNLQPNDPGAKQIIGLQ